MLSIARRIQRAHPCLLQTARQFQAARTDSGGSKPNPRRRSKHAANLKLKTIDDTSEWWVVDGEMHEIGENVPLRERFVIPRDNLPNRRRKMMREQFMRRTRLVLKEAEHEPWCKRYMELYEEMRENWERLYWDEGYSKKLAQDHANYDSAEDDDEDFNPYKRRQQYSEPMKEGGFGRNRQDGGFGRNRQEGDFGRNRQEGDFGRNRQEGDFGRNRQEGGYGRYRQEGDFGRHRLEGGFERNRQEGGFERNRQEGDFGRNRPEGDFGRNRQGGGFGRNMQGDNTWEKDGGIGRNRQGDNTLGNVSSVRDKFEYDRERRMREKAFAPMTGGNDFAMDNPVSKNQPFDTRRYVSDDSDSDSY